MSTQQPDTQLQQILQFEPDELEMNRNGSLSLPQRGRLLIEVDRLFLIFLVVVPITLAGWLIGQMPLVAVLGAGAFVIITGLLNRSSVRVVMDVFNGKILSVTGKLKVTVYAYDRRTYAGILGEKYANGVINETRFIVPVGMQPFADNEITVYYTSHYRKAVSAQMNT